MQPREPFGKLGALQRIYNKSTTNRQGRLFTIELLDGIRRGRFVVNTLLLAVVVFSTVFGAGLLLMQPVFTQYLDTYAVRVRPRKAKEESLEEPSSSAIVSIRPTQVSRSLG